MNILEKVSREEVLNVLVVGNNPTELGRVFDSLGKMPVKRTVTEIAFDLPTVLQRIARFTPDYILIDDNIGKSELKNAIRALLKYRRTKKIPITVLKNSNYQEAFGRGILNYVLKEQLNGESLYRALKYSLRSLRTQNNLLHTYRARKGQFLRLIS